MPVYVLMASGGFILLVILTVFDWLGDLLDTGLDAVLDMFTDLDVDGGGTRWLSSYSLIAFIGFAGIGGFLSQRYLGANDGLSVIFALFFGLCGGGLAALFMSWMRRQERSTHIASGSLVGHEATVTVTIPDNGIGEVNVVIEESHRFGARSTDGGSIPRGTIVAIEKEGTPLIVRRKR